MFPEVLVESALFGCGLSVITYALCETFFERLRLKSIHPLLLAVPVIIAILKLVPGVTYENYSMGAEFINVLLGTATIALALPLYKNRMVIAAEAPAILGGVALGVVTAILVTFFVGKCLGASEQVILSLVPKSVTAPIAIEVSKAIGGIPPLTMAGVIPTGMLGATFNHKILAFLGIKNDIAIGIAIGGSSHAIGTSVCASVSPVQLATGSVAIALSGIATSILAPLLLPLLEAL